MRNASAFACVPLAAASLLAAACGSSAPSAEHDDSVEDAGGPYASSTSSASSGGEHAGSSSSSSSRVVTSATGSSATKTEPTPDGGPIATDGGPPATDGPLAAMAAATPDTWTWVPFAESRCGNGSSTGIGWNPHAGATHLLIYLQGGGACTDADSCWGADATASNMSGYGATDFAGDPTLGAVIFQRTSGGSTADGTNPWEDADLAFVPYCTGDLHVGTGLVSYTVNGVATPTYFHGASNVDLFAAALASVTKASKNSPLSRVYLSGVSAGGFGSFLNQDAVAQAFGGVRVDVVDDSGPAITGTGIPSDWSARLPPACTTCVDANSVFLFARKTYPDSRYGLLTFQTDDVLPLFFGVSDQAFATEIQQFVTSLAPDPNAKAFVDTSTGHVVLEETDPAAVPYILPWLTQLATDDPAWATVSH